MGIVLGLFSCISILSFECLSIIFVFLPLRRFFIKYQYSRQDRMCLNLQQFLYFEQPNVGSKQRGSLIVLLSSLISLNTSSLIVGATIRVD